MSTRRESMELLGSRDKRPEPVVKMPNKEQMLGKLGEMGIGGLSPQVNSFYDRFAELVADSPKAGLGLNYAWEIAKSEALENAPDMILDMVDMNYNDVMDAVTPDRRVANQAKAARTEMLKEMKNKQSDQII